MFELELRAGIDIHMHKRASIITAESIDNIQTAKWAKVLMFK